jgi:hypothetical protein
MEPDVKEHVLSLLKDAINHYGLGRIETAKLDVQEKFQLSGQQVEQLVTHLNGGVRAHAGAGAPPDAADAPAEVKPERAAGSKAEADMLIVVPSKRARGEETAGEQKDEVRGPAGTCFVHTPLH